MNAKRTGITVFSAILIFLLFASAALAEWSYPGWAYRREIILDNSQNANALYGFQMTMTIPYCRGMQPDFDDLRFALSDGCGTPLIPYWMEGFIENDHAVILARIPEIPANGMASLYVYYGNSSAQSESNGMAVFDFFDDFNDGDMSDWTVIKGSWTAQNKYLEQFVTANHRQALSQFVFGTDHPPAIIEAKLNYMSGYAYSGVHVFLSDSPNGSNGYKYGFAGYNVNGSRIVRIVNEGCTNIDDDPAINNQQNAYQWVNLKAIYKPSGYFCCWLTAPDNTEVFLEASDQTFSPPYILGAYVGSHIGIDDLRVRQFADPEPQYSIGKEENNAPWNPDESRPGISLISPCRTLSGHFQLQLPNPATVAVSLYDCAGRKLSIEARNTLLNRGRHIISLGDGLDNCSGGILFLLVNVSETNGRTYELREKFVLIK
jgi:hypothetical protein